MKLSTVEETNFRAVLRLVGVSRLYAPLRYRTTSRNHKWWWRWGC